MERCGFFDANLVGEEYDRVYLASQFAAYFASFIGNGIFAEHSNQLQVMEMATPQMQIVVERGQAWINGYWYENTDMLYLPIDVADGVLNRIDSVVLRLGFSERNIWLAVKKGTPAVNPVAPEVTRNADYYELQLATISIPAGSIKITQAQITDTRMNKDVCGWVTGVIDQVDTTTLFNQYVDWYTTTTGQAEADIETIMQQFQDNLTQFEQNWNDWFSQQQTEGFVMAVEKGQPNGIATLNENGKIPNEQLPGIEAFVTSVNGQTGDVVLTADDIGAETPAGAQAKVDTLAGEGNTKTVKQLSDEVTSHMADYASHMADYASHKAESATTAGNLLNLINANTSAIDAHKVESATLETLGHVKHGVFTTTLWSADWAGTAAPFTQAKTISGILAIDTPIVDVVMSGTYSTDEARAEAWGYIYRAVTGADSITFYATDKPTVDLPIQIRVVR